MPLPPLVAPSADLSPAEVARYSRHLVLAGFGEAGQRRLKNARVLVIGAGGLGEPIITGLQLSDNLMILSGALPAAGLALFFEAALGKLEVVLAPRA